jgi:glycosyltransferase involved in cell wall biosynthesis
MANSGRLADYLAASVPVVTSDVPNLEALVYKWNLGSCCNPYEPGSIAEAIRRVVEGPPGLTERRQLVRRAFQDELHFERRGRLLASEITRLWRERCFR